MLRAFFMVLFAAALAAAPADHFETRVRPLLAAKCYACHAEAKMGGLRLDSREALLAGGARGPAIEPGDSSASLLIQAVRREQDELKMPPTEALSAEEVAVLETWIDAGAPWPEAEAVSQAPAGAIRPEAREFWSFQPVRRPEPPAVETKQAAKNEIDRFVLARIEQAGLEPAPPADKRTLIRRATLDLLGLPPTPKEVADFLADESPEAFAAVVDRLLDSPHYGERMARRWLDLARYGDGLSAAQQDVPLANAWRYRDWVVDAFNEDMPYDRFVTAQLAADLMEGEDCDELLPALGFHALRDRDDDRVDVTSRALLGLTVGCAQCHDHKFDPIPQSDFYSLQGVFSSSDPHEFPLAPANQVEEYKAAQKLVADQKLKIDTFLEKQTEQLTLVLMERTADYLVAAWRVKTGHAEVAAAAEEAALDEDVLGRWLDYLDRGEREHPYLDEWTAFLDRGGSREDARDVAQAFERQLFAIRDEKLGIDDRNYVALGGAKGVRDQRTLLNTNLEFLDPVKYYLWRDLAEAPGRKQGIDYRGGVYHVGPKDIERYLSGPWLDYLHREREQLKRLEDAVPEPYPFLHAYQDAEKPKDARIAIRGDKKNLGDAAPRRFLQILSPEEPEPFVEGSGRLELARAIASKDNPLTARVMANRLWSWRFGRGIVASPSNFGQLGERPTHPALLDWLAAELMDNGWSLKALDRKILLSAAYRRSSTILDANQRTDAANSLLWRFNPVERLDAETLRDSVLAVSGKLDRKVGGPPEPLNENNSRRALYGKIERTSPDRTMTLFDFPDPKSHAEERSVTVGPLHRLYFLNNPFVLDQAKAFADRLAREAGDDPRSRIALAYELAFSRPPTAGETAAALEFLATEPWPRYTQMLLASSEFFTVR